MTIFAGVTVDDSLEFQAALQMYVESFPANERHPVDVIRERVLEGRYTLIVGRIQNEVVFFALLWPLRGSDFVLLDYMATKSDYRGRGIGREFLSGLQRMPEMSGKSLLMEVEEPSVGENREQRRKRVEFYRRDGARELKGVRYFMPGLSGGPPTKMILMTLANEEKRAIGGETVREAIIQIYRELYNRAADDSLLNTFIHELPEQVPLV